MTAVHQPADRELQICDTLLRNSERIITILARHDIDIVCTQRVQTRILRVCATGIRVPTVVHAPTPAARASC
eukprot:2627631-Prymnesium_polylepis.2